MFISAFDKKQPMIDEQVSDTIVFSSNFIPTQKDNPIPSVCSSIPRHSNISSTLNDTQKKLLEKQDEYNTIIQSMPSSFNTREEIEYYLPNMTGSSTSINRRNLLLLLDHVKQIKTCMKTLKQNIRTSTDSGYIHSFKEVYGTYRTTLRSFLMRISKTRSTAVPKNMEQPIRLFVTFLQRYETIVQKYFKKNFILLLLPYTFNTYSITYKMRCMSIPIGTVSFSLKYDSLSKSYKYFKGKVHFYKMEKMI